NGQVHGQMQKRIDLSFFYRKFLLGGIRVLKCFMIFRVLQNPGERHGLHWRKDFMLPMFGPGFGKKLANLIAGWIEHTNRVIKNGVVQARGGMTKKYTMKQTQTGVACAPTMPEGF